jgi:hypothetical protein
MNQEASQFALELEQIGRRILASCHGLPDAVLQWPLPLAAPCSLFSLAEQVIRAIDYWVLIQIGDRSPACTPSHPLGTFAELSERYEEWIHSVHIILDALPDVFLDLFVGTRFCEQSRPDEYLPCEPMMTARHCLLHALTQCAECTGQILLIRKLFDDGNRILAPMEQGQQVYR